MINAAHLGIGPSGQKMVRFAVQRGCFNIDGEPGIQSRIAGGVNGDIATCAITLNAVRSVLRATPGLKTMGDIPSVAFFNETVV